MSSKQTIIEQLEDVLATLEAVGSGEVPLGDVQPAVMEASDTLSAAIEDVDNYLTDDEEQASA